MELIDRTDIIVASIIRFFVDGTLDRWLHDAPAQLSRFWSTDPTVATGVSLAQLIAAFCSVLFLSIIVLTTLRRRELVPAAAPAAPGEAAELPVPGLFQERWGGIMGRLESPHEAEWKLAVLEADKLVDDAMAHAGFSGGTFGDRLTAIAPGTLASLDGLWWAHKVRNRLVHEVDYFLRYTEARQAIGYFQQTLEELRLL